MNLEQLQVILSLQYSIYVRSDIFSSSTPGQITDNNSDNSIHGQKSADQDLKSSDSYSVIRKCNCQESWISTYVTLVTKHLD